MIQNCGFSNKQGVLATGSVCQPLAVFQNTSHTHTLPQIGRGFKIHCHIFAISSNMFGRLRDIIHLLAIYILSSRTMRWL